MFDVEYFTLTGVDATVNRFVELSGSPISGNDVALDLVGGTAQALTSDFMVDGTRVKWDFTTSPLYTDMSNGDRLRVIYDRSL